MRGTIRASHDSRRTEESYVGWIRRFILFHGKRHPAEMGAPLVTALLTAPAVERQVSAATQNQALPALQFLYDRAREVEPPSLDEIVRAKRSTRLPLLTTREEVRAVLSRFEGTAALATKLLYGARLRLLEGLRLRAATTSAHGR